MLAVMSCERISISLTKAGTKYEVFDLLALQKMVGSEIRGSDKQRRNMTMMMVMMNRKRH